MILTCPIAKRIYDIFSDHSFFCGYLITTCGCIRILCLILRIHAIKIIARGLVEAAVKHVVGVIVNHIHNHANSGLMDCMNHLFILFYSDSSIKRIRGIRALRNIIVIRVIAPVVLFKVRSAFIYASKII